MMRAADAWAAAEQLRALLAAIDAGDIDATADERAHLTGALDTLDQLAGPHRRRVRRTAG